MEQDTLAIRVRDKYRGFRRMLEWRRVSTNWRDVFRHRRDKGTMPPIQMRTGEILHHGPFDSPLLLLDEVWVRQWYLIDATPPRAGIMLDIGANIGSVTLFWAQRAPSLTVHCYEPNPAAFETLRQNVEANRLQQRVYLHPQGVGRNAGVLRLWVDIPTDFSTAYMDESPVEGGRRIEVPVVSIDEVWQQAGGQDVWLLKIDTEGAEVDILEGASKAFLDSVQNAIIEFHDNIYPGASERCLRVLEAARLQCRVMHHPGLEGIIYARRS